MAQERFQPGAKIAGHTIQKRIGAGGFGEVYKAVYDYNQLDVAIKFPKLPENTPDNPKAKEQFQHLFFKEAKTIAYMSHRNIIPFFWYGTENLPTQQNPAVIEAQPMIVTAYANEGSLRSFMERNGGIPVDQAVDFLIQAANGLQHAHDRRTLHRDIKPDNLLLHKDHPEQNHLDVWVADFGIAITAHPLNTPARLTPQDAMSTVYYAPIEQQQGQAKIPSDIYSLGVVAYQLLTKKLPFYSDNAVSVSLAHLQDTPPSFAEARRGIKRNTVIEALEEPVLWALKKDPADRPQSMEVFALTLQGTHAKAKEKVQGTIIDMGAVTRPIPQSNRHGEITPTVPAQSGELPPTQLPGKSELTPTKAAYPVNPHLPPTKLAEPVKFIPTDPDAQVRQERLRRDESVRRWLKQSRQQKPVERVISEEDKKKVRQLQDKVVEMRGVVEENEFKEVLPLYDKLIELDPKNSNTWHGKANALHRLRRYEEAIVAYDKAISTNPQELEYSLFNDKGGTLNKLGRHEEALQAYDKASQIDPDRPNAYYNKANALHKLGRYDEALQAYEKVLELVPDNSLAQNRIRKIKKKRFWKKIFRV